MINKTFNLNKIPIDVIFPSVFIISGIFALKLLKFDDFFFKHKLFDFIWISAVPYIVHSNFCTKEMYLFKKEKLIESLKNRNKNTNSDKFCLRRKINFNNLIRKIRNDQIYEISNDEILSKKIIKFILNSKDYKSEINYLNSENLVKFLFKNLNQGSKNYEFFNKAQRDLYNQKILCKIKEIRLLFTYKSINFISKQKYKKNTIAKLVSQLFLEN